MPNRSDFLRLLHFWWPAVLAAILISTFSTQDFGEDHTSRIIIPFLQWLLPHASEHTVHVLHVGIRKLAHIVEFGTFSILVFRGVRAGRSGWRISWALWTLLIIACYASLDEIHQIFVPNRGASPRDVAIDVTGALIVQAMVWWYGTGKWPFSSRPLISSAQKETAR